MPPKINSIQKFKEGLRAYLHTALQEFFVDVSPSSLKREDRYYLTSKSLIHEKSPAELLTWFCEEDGEIKLLEMHEFSNYLRDCTGENVLVFVPFFTIQLMTVESMDEAREFYRYLETLFNEEG